MKRVIAWITSGIPLPTWPAEAGLLLLRCYAGLSLFLTVGRGRFDIRSWQIDPVFMGMVNTLNLPAPILFAALAIFAETVGALLFAVGLGTRLWALMLTVTLGLAAFAINRVHFYRELHVTQLLFWVFVCFVFIGSGRVSLDSVLRKWLSRRKII